MFWFEIIDIDFFLLYGNKTFLIPSQNRKHHEKILQKYQILKPSQMTQKKLSNIKQMSNCRIIFIEVQAGFRSSWEYGIFNLQAVPILSRETTNFDEKKCFVNLCRHLNRIRKEKSWEFQNFQCVIFDSLTFASDITFTDSLWNSTRK